MKETAHLLRSAENTSRLLASIERLERGGGTVRKLADRDPEPASTETPEGGTPS